MAAPLAAPERIVPVNGAALCTQTFGHAGDPPVLLIAGMSSSMLHWADEFCARLAAGPRFVIRYDHRDTGRSTCSPPGAPDYTGRDLVEDAIGVLDALKVDAAHVVGISMGGGIAQVLAIRHPERIVSLTLVSSTPAARPAGAAPLPDPDGRLTWATPPDWSARDTVIDYLTAEELIYSSVSRPVPEEFVRGLATRTVDRATNIASIGNHVLLADQDDGVGPDDLARITARTLVVHGTEDPLLPHPHGVALAEAIPGARLLTLEHTGHELPPATWDDVIPAILDTSRDG